MTKLWRLLREEEGQSMLEFAMVLPILLVLTIGTLYLTTAFMHKSRMNGLAYMSARVAAVRNDAAEGTQYTLKRYQQQTQQSWVNKVQVAEQQISGENVFVALRKPGERIDILANAIDILSGSAPHEPSDIYAAMRLPLEYSPLNGSARPRTYTTVDYRSAFVTSGDLPDDSPNMPDIPWEKLLDVLPKSILDTTQMADEKPGSVKEQGELISTSPPNTQIKKFYEDRGLKYATNSEKEGGQLARMQTIGEYFKAIEAGGDMLGYLIHFSGFAGPLTDLLGGSVETLAKTAETTMNNVHKAVAIHNCTTFARDVADAVGDCQ
jgi:uncharacterized protein (UPF0333 family)